MTKEKDEIIVIDGEQIDKVTLYCDNCGNELKNSYKFCPYCGCWNPATKDKPIINESDLKQVSALDSSSPHFVYPEKLIKIKVAFGWIYSMLSVLAILNLVSLVFSIIDKNIISIVTFFITAVILIIFVFALKTFSNVLSDLVEKEYYQIDTTIMEDEKFCEECGKIIPKDYDICQFCSTQQQEKIESPINLQV